MTEAARIASIDSLQSLLTDCRNTGDQLSAQIKKLLRDTTQMGNSIRQYQSMLSTNMTEQEKLNALLSQKKNELSERERTLDEPTRGIDVGAHAEIIRLIETLCADGLALLVISSELEELVGYADRVIIMRDRKQVAEIPLAELSVPAIMNAIAA